MAYSGLPPEAIPPDINYKCHPSTKNATVFCLLCDNVFHKSDFNRKKNGKYITNVAVICDSHPDFNITSDNESDPSVILCKLKEMLHEKEKKIEKLIYENIQLKELLEISNDANCKNSENMELDETMQEGDPRLVNEYNKQNYILINENTLLKDLNTALKDKNKLLEELLQKEKDTPKVNTQACSHSYASAVSALPRSLNLNTIQQKSVPKIIIKKKNKDDKTPQIKEKVLHYLTKDKNIQTKTIITKNNDEIIINCMNLESAKSAEKILESKMSKIVKIEKEQIKKPVIKIVGIENIFNLDQSELENDINTRNFAKQENKGKILHMYKNKQEKTTIIMEISAELHKMIKENKDKLFVGYQNCKTYDVINVKPCYNCGRFGHNGSKCRNNTTCLKCAGSHKTSECQNHNKICCANCDYINKKYNKNKYNTEHLTTDSEKCLILRNKINNEINTTDYTVKPIIPRYVVNIENK